MSPSKKTMSPTKKAIPPRKVLFPTKAVPGKSCFKRTITTSPSKKPSSSSPSKKTGAKYFSFMTSDNVQVMKIPLIGRGRKVQPASQIISPEKKPAQDLTKPLQPSKVRKSAAKKLKITKPAGCVVSPGKRPSRRFVQQLQFAKTRLPTSEKVKVVKQVDQVKLPQKTPAECLQEQSELTKIGKAADDKLQSIKRMVWNWEQHGGVNEERLKKIILHIDKVMIDGAEAERMILYKSLWPMRDELGRLAYELEWENAGFAEIVKMSMTKANAVDVDRNQATIEKTSQSHATQPSERHNKISIEEFGVPLGCRSPAEILSDQESLRLLLAVKDHQKSSISKKIGMLTKKWKFGPVTVSFSSMQSKKNSGDDGLDIMTFIFVLLLVVLVLVQVY